MLLHNKRTKKRIGMIVIDIESFPVRKFANLNCGSTCFRFPPVLVLLDEELVGLAHVTQLLVDLKEGR